MNEILRHQQAALEEILSMMRELIHYQDPRLKSAKEHLDEVKRIMESKQMVMASLHVICGNCGCNDEWELRITRNGDDVSVDEVKFEDSANMVCANCGTIHDLKDNATKVTLSEPMIKMVTIDDYVDNGE